MPTPDAQTQCFTTKCAAHFNRLTLRNGISLAGLTRNPVDLETFFRTALFFISEAGRQNDLSEEIFRERLEHFRSRFAAWIVSSSAEIFEAMKGCGIVAVSEEGRVCFTAPESKDFTDLSAVQACWRELEGERVRRRHRVRAQLQAKNRECNAPKPVTADPELDRRLMVEALVMARRAFESDEVPVGAVVVIDGNIVASACNEVITRHDPTAHAEILAIRKAAAMLGNERLVGATLYVTLEPCPMCAAACSMARVARVVWGADDPDCGGMRGALDVAAKAHLNHRPAMTPGVMRAECERLLRDFFKDKRARSQKQES